MDVVFILGPHNSGKSSLVLCLTGLGRGNHRHPSSRNIAKLVWLPGPTALDTFCLISSLNEGDLYFGTRVSGNAPVAFGTNNTIAPHDLDAVLASYVGRGCSKAILCISTSEMTPGWQAGDYLSLVVGGHIGQHSVSHILGVGLNGPGVTSVPFVLLPCAPNPRNDIAAQARLAIGLV